MNLTKKISFSLALCCIAWLIPVSSMAATSDPQAPSTKKERNRITKGNKLYNEEKYKEALQEYKLALEENPSSIIALYNMGLSEIRIGSNPNDTTKAAKDLLNSGINNLKSIANLGSGRPLLASKANYNLGNLSYNKEDYQGAIESYKQALRLNPEDNDARHNLRLAQLKLQNQEDNKDQQDQQNQDQQDQDNQEQEKENQDQDQQDENNQDQNRDQQQEQDQQNQDQSSINPQTAEQILNAMENKENQTRARVAGQNAEKSRQRNRNPRNW